MPKAVIKTGGGSSDGSDVLPELSADLPSLKDIHAGLKDPKDANLPVDFLLLTVKDYEFLACFMQVRDPFRCWFDGVGYVYFGEIGEGQEEKLKVALMRCYQGFTGPVDSLITVKNAVHVLRPKAVISVGTCSGLNTEKTKLGDVVVSAKVKAYESKIVTSNGDESTAVRSYVSRQFLDVIKYAGHGWKAPLKDPEVREVKVHCDGEFLSGPELISGERQHDELVKSSPWANAIEMEGEGVSGAFIAAFDVQIEWLVVKGISDYADSTECMSENWNPFASVMAASVVANILSNPAVFQEWAHYEGESACVECHLPEEEIEQHTEGLNEKITLKIKNVSLEETITPMDNTKKVLHTDKNNREQQDRISEGRAYNNLANECFNQGDFRKTIDYLKLYLGIVKKVGNRAGEGRAYANLGNAYLSLGDSEEAINCLQIQLGIAKELKNRAGEGRAYSNLGNAYLARGDVNKAIEYHKQHLNIAKELGDRAGERRAYANLGNAYDSVNDFKTSISYHQQHLSIAKDMGDRAGEGHVYANLGIAYRNLGNFEKAIEYHKLDLSIAVEVGDKAGEGKTYSNLGNTYLSQCEYKKAIEYYLNCLFIAKEMGDRVGEEGAYANLGNAYLSLGDFAKTMECHKKHLSIAKELGDRAGEGGAYANLGIAYGSVGDYETAIEYHKRDLQIASELGDRTGEGRANANLGNAFFALSDFKKAVEYHNLHLGIAKEVRDKAGEGIAYGNLGIGYRKLGNFRKAIQYHQLHLSTAKEVGDKTGEGRAYSNLGISYCNLGDFKEAMYFHQLHLRIAKEVEDRSGEGSAYGNLGIVYYNLGNFNEAVVNHLQHLEIAKQVGDRAGEGNAYGNLGNACDSLGDFKKAVEYHQKHLQIAKQLGDKAGEGHAHGNLGNAFGSLGNFKRAIEYHNHHLAIAKEVGDRAGEGRAFANLGISSHNVGDFKSAIDYHYQHLHIAKESGDRSGEGGAYANLGNAFDSLGDFKKAIEYHQKHLQIANEVGDKAGIGRAYANLGIAYRNLGDYIKAIDYQQRDLTIAKEVGDKAGEGLAYANLGISYCNLGDFKKGIEYQELGLKIAKEVEDRAGEGRAYANLGNAYDSLGDIKTAIDYHQRHLSIAIEVGDRAGEGRAYANLGNNYFSLCNFKEAVEYHQKHLSIAKEVGDRAGEGSAYANLGNAFLSLDDFKIAVQYHQQHLDIAKEVGDIAGEGGAYANLGNVYGLLGDSQKALHYHGRELSIAKDVGDIAAEGRAYANLGDTYVSLGKLDKSEECYESSVRLFDKIRELLSFRDEWKISLRDHHDRVYNALWRVHLKQGKIKKALLTAERGRAQALTDLMKSVYGIDMIPHNTHVTEGKDIDTWYYITSLTVFIAIGRNDINTWVLRKGESIQFRQVEINKECLERGATHFLTRLIQDAYQEMDVRSSIENRLYQPGNETMSNVREVSKLHINDSDTPLQILRKALIDPIEELIKGEEVIIVPEGPLLLVPFVALQNHRQSFLGESLKIRLIPSLTTLKLIVDCPDDYHNTKGALLVGDPWVAEVYGPGRRRRLRQLPFAQEEVKMIGRLLNVDPLIGKNATKSEVLKRLNSVALVHIAAHGSKKTGEIALSPNAERSSRIPSEDDYLLKMKDIIDTTVRAKLVVLSTCHSGHGEIKAEGVVGIARAFLGAGASSVLVTLWEVEDEATFEFMKLFYQHLVEGKTVNDAVSQAQKCLRKSEKYSATKNWAPFVLIGNDTTLDFEKKE